MVLGYEHRQKVLLGRSKWLHNVNEGNNSWMKIGSQGESSTVICVKIFFHTKIMTFFCKH